MREREGGERERLSLCRYVSECMCLGGVCVCDLTLGIVLIDFVKVCLCLCTGIFVCLCVRSCFWVDFFPFYIC